MNKLTTRGRIGLTLAATTVSAAAALAATTGSANGVTV